MPITLLFVLALAGGPAAQSGPEAAARARYAAGNTAFQAGRYQEALAEFEDGYRLAPRPAFVLNVAHCWRRLGDLPQARAAYRRYLIVDPQSARRGEVEDVIRELDTVMAEQASLAARVAVAPAPVWDPKLATAAPPRRPPPSAPLWRRWWFWAGASAIVAGTAALAVASGGSSGGSQPTLGTLRR